jgi:hypothetical protein
MIHGLSSNEDFFLSLTPKEGRPPFLPEAGWRCAIRMARYALLLLVICPDDDDWLLSGANIAELLACLALDDGRILIVITCLHKLVMLILHLLQFLLCSIDLLHELTIRPGLRKRSKEEGGTDKAGNPHHGLRE